MDKEQEGLKEDYLPTTVSKEYKDLFDKVCDLTRTKAINNPAKKLQPPISSPEFCEVFFAFLKPKQSNWQHNVEFKKLITKELRRSYDTFMKWQSGGIPEKGNYSHTCFCISAQVHETKVEEHLAKFLDEWINGHDPNITLPGLIDFKKDIEKLRAKYNSSNDQDVLVTQSSRHGIERVEGQEKWLSPCNYDALPLVGRKKEVELLDNFIKSDGQFKIWAIAGPSGSGKTRLAYEWAYDSEVLKDWDRRVLHKEDLSTPKKWENWSPDRPTLIIIDYLYGFEKIVLELMNRRSMLTEHKIRLLLIDHIFSKPLYSDKRWGFSGDQESFDRNEKFFHGPTPLDLEKTENQAEIIKSIIAKRADIDLGSNQIKEAHDYLLNTEGAYRPLFAALIADAINSGKDFNSWNRRELINYYLSGEKRLPWEHEDLGMNGLWASHFIAAATARRGMNYNDLFEATENCKSAPVHFGDAQEICQKAVTDKNEIILKPLEPDILGESFFLKFLQFIKKSNKYKTEFQQVFIAVDEKAQTKDAMSFIAFIQRLTRNLLNDDQNQKETQELWDALFDFMRPSKYSQSDSLKWALTAALVDIVDAIQDQFPEKELITLLNRIEPAVLYHVHNSNLLADSVLYSMRYFELTSKLITPPPAFSEVMSALFGCYETKRNIYEITLLMIASYYGFNETINALIDRGVDIEATLISSQNVPIGGLNALILASAQGHTEAVKQLLNAGAKTHGANNKGQTALHVASINGHIKVAKLLLEKGADIYSTDNEGNTALIWASTKGHVDVAKLLLDKGANINATDNEGYTVLHVASINGHVKVAKLLVDEGADIYSTDNEGNTALILAIIVGHVDVAKLLLDKGTNIHVTDNKGKTALHWASTAGHVEVVKMLLDEGANIDAINNKGKTALHWASINGHVKVVKLLLDEEAEIDVADSSGFTALFETSNNGHVEVIKLLLDKGANINATDNEGRTVLFWTSSNGHVDATNLLLDKGADIHAVDNEGRTVLFYASNKGHVELAKLLLDEGAEIDVADRKGFTALTEASNKGHVEVVKLLLDKGANINATDNEGYTVLVWASTAGHVDAAKLLFDKGANFDAADDKDNIALVWASANGHVDVIKLLLDKGANIHATDNEGSTALIWASTKGHVDVAKLLLDKGANINVTNNNGQTALHHASINGHVKVAKLLLEKGADIHTADIDGATTLMWASLYGHVEVIKLLLDEGVDIHVTDYNGNTALILAIIAGHVDVAKLLLDKGANIDATDN
ncbi:MAG: hypothetical protein NMNS01_21230 [Nitrosomonas sp.]|nr:MAG: hypothetical protein NMNS01_21230 [Nitrosomonas sp.]